MNLGDWPLMWLAVASSVIALYLVDRYFFWRRNKRFDKQHAKS